MWPWRLPSGVCAERAELPVTRGGAEAGPNGVDGDVDRDGTRTMLIVDVTAVEPPTEQVVDLPMSLVVGECVPMVDPPDQLRDVLHRALDDQVVVVSHQDVDVAEHARSVDGALEGHIE